MRCAENMLPGDEPPSWCAYPVETPSVLAKWLARKTVKNLSVYNIVSGFGHLRGGGVLGCRPKGGLSPGYAHQPGIQLRGVTVWGFLRGLSVNLQGVISGIRGNNGEAMETESITWKDTGCAKSLLNSYGIHRRRRFAFEVNGEHGSVQVEMITRVTQVTPAS